MRTTRCAAAAPTEACVFQLCVVLDIFSRYVVAWTVQNTEDSGIAVTMLEEAMAPTASPRPFTPTGAPR